MEESEMTHLRTSNHHWSALTTLVSSLAILASALSLASAQPLTVTEFPEVRQEEAAFVLQGGQAFHGNAQTIRCGPGQRVGAWSAAGPATQLSNVVIDMVGTADAPGCAVGLVVEGTDVDVSSVTIRGPGLPQTEGPPPLLQPVPLVTQSTLCAADYGLYGTSAYNDVSGCQYGGVIGSRERTYYGNHIHHNTIDGVVLLGMGNTLEQNQILSNGGTGLNVIPAAPMATSTWVLKGLKHMGSGNTIKSNTITGSGGQDLRQWPASCTSLPNVYQNNTANKRSPTCLQ
jgi:parallel beta-helix repeat protein